MIGNAFSLIAPNSFDTTGTTLVLALKTLHEHPGEECHWLSTSWLRARNACVLMSLCLREGSISLSACYTLNMLLDQPVWQGHVSTTTTEDCLAEALVSLLKQLPHNLFDWPS
jgi:hypothetical protein